MKFKLLFNVCIKMLVKHFLLLLLMWVEIWF